jgi:hypothetical protein
MSRRHPSSAPALLAILGCVISFTGAAPPLAAQDPAAGEAPRAEPTTGGPSRGERSAGAPRRVGTDDRAAGALVREPGAQTARIVRGWVPVVDLLAFIEETSGHAVIYPSVHQDPSFGENAKIHFLADRDSFDADFAIVYLERNGYDCSLERLTPDRLAYSVTSRNARSASPRPIPGPERIYGPKDLLPPANHTSAGPIRRCSRIRSRRSSRRSPDPSRPCRSMRSRRRTGSSASGTFRR